MINIKITNIKELIRKIDNIKLWDTLNASLKKSLFFLDRNMKIVTPVDTWLLRNSYEKEYSDLEVRLVNFREYWPIVDARQWFVDKGIGRSEAWINRIINDDLNRLLSKI